MAKFSPDPNLSPEQQAEAYRKAAKEIYIFKLTEYGAYLKSTNRNSLKRKIDLLEQAVGLGSRPAMIDLIECCEQLGDLDGATRWKSRFEEETGKTLQPVEDRSLNITQVDDSNKGKAETLYNKALRNHVCSLNHKPTSVLPRKMNLHHLKKAIRILEKSLELGETEAMRTLKECYEYLGDTPTAEYWKQRYETATGKSMKPVENRCIVGNPVKLAARSTTPISVPAVKEPPKPVSSPSTTEREPIPVKKPSNQKPESSLSNQEKAASSKTESHKARDYLHIPNMIELGLEGVRAAIVMEMVDGLNDVGWEDGFLRMDDAALEYDLSELWLVCANPDMFEEEANAPQWRKDYVRENYAMLLAAKYGYEKATKNTGLSKEKIKELLEKNFGMSF